MTDEEFSIAINKLRTHIKANPRLAETFANAVDEACKEANLSLPKEFFDGLIIAHVSEMDSAFAVTVILPVGSQCGL